MSGAVARCKSQLLGERFQRVKPSSPVSPPANHVQSSATFVDATSEPAGTSRDSTATVLINLVIADAPKRWKTVDERVLDRVSRMRIFGNRSQKLGNERIHRGRPRACVGATELLERNGGLGSDRVALAAAPIEAGFRNSGDEEPREKPFLLCERARIHAFLKLLLEFEILLPQRKR